MVVGLRELMREMVVTLSQLEKLVRVANGSGRGGFQAGTSVVGYGIRARSARLRLCRSTPDVSGWRNSFFVVVRLWGGSVPLRSASVHRLVRAERVVAVDTES